MVRRLLSVALFVLLPLVLVVVNQIPEDQSSSKATYKTQRIADSAQEAPPPVPHVCDPAEFQALREGRGHPQNQHWYNYLRTDGQDPDYLRFYVACHPEHEVAPRFWHPDYRFDSVSHDRRWSTEEYFCVRGLLDGEHGNQAWDTWHRHQPGPNPPQAMPYSKIAGLTMRETYEWMVDYINGRYGGPFHTPNPCHAGY